MCTCFSGAYLPPLDSSAPEGNGLSVTHLWMPRGSYGPWKVTVCTVSAETSAAA